MILDVLVIGGGPAGAAAAIRLAEDGARVMLVERERTPVHKVCGEFLSGEALSYLERLGLDLVGMGALPLQRVALESCRNMNALPFPAMSLTRRRLDDQLLRRADASGACVRLGCQVERLERSRALWHATLAGGEQITAGAVFIACGKHDLRGHPRPKGKQPGMIAFKMYWHLSAEEAGSLEHAVELFSFPGGYGGLQPVEDGLVNLCCLVQGNAFRKLGGRWEALLARMRSSSCYLRQRLCHAEPQLEKPLTVSSIPYGFLRQVSDGLWYLGDQAVVIPSFTGDGISLALHTGALAARMYLQGEPASFYQSTVAKQLYRQVAFATGLSKALVSAPRLSMWAACVLPGMFQTIAHETRIDPGMWTANIP